MTNPEPAVGRRPRPSKGESTRQAILAAAADLTSVRGLTGLSIAALAEAVGMSKSGLYAHFGSKEGLQLAAIETAREIAGRAIFGPVRNLKPGFEHLSALCESYVSYQERKVFPGGCFFGNVSAEVDAHPGPIRDRIAAVYAGLINRFAEAVRGAQATGEIDPAADPEQVSFELVAVIREGGRLCQLDDDPEHYARARRAVRERLGALATAAARRADATPPRPAGGDDVS